MAKDWPVGVVALTIWAYWGTVILLAAYKRLQYGQRAGVFPRKRAEKRLWLGMVPVFLAWNTLPALAAVLHRGPFGLPRWADAVPAIYGVRCAAAALAVLCYLATLNCWLRMGRNWTMAIVPGQRTDLVTGGLFGWVRHPIYALSILLMLCTAVVAPTWPMLLVAALHVALMNLKAQSEERHLAERHGSSYADYCRRVGRFFPRLRTQAGR